jgi:CHAT domain-containing protein
LGASGRLFIARAGRDRTALRESPVFVADPASADIPWATLEADNIRAACYPGSRSLSSQRSGDPATPDRVLACLPARDRPGASLLHLSCHARAGASPEASHLLLVSGAHLPVSSILRQAQGRRVDAPGGLVVLSACMSDLTTRDFDEALTLATAFLAAGAVSVVGSRWQVGDVRTALLMFMFHHYLSQEQPPPVALRSAQLWMLDPRRVVPEVMPQDFADEVPRHELAQETAWAAFACQGQ